MKNFLNCRWIKFVLQLIILHILLDFYFPVSVNADKALLLIEDNYTDIPKSSPTSVSSRNSNPQISVIITSCACILIAIVGILGNLLVICVLAGSHTRLVYETFCVGLAATDLTYLSFATPITVVQYYFRGWIFGFFWCKVFNFIIQVTVFSSAFMLLGLTTSRFLSVVLPWQNLKMTELQAKLFCLGAWIAGVIFASPVLVFQVLIPSSDVSLKRINQNGNSTTGAFTVGSLANGNSTCIETSTEKDPVLFCRGLFPSQSSRMGYQLLVLLSTYVIPFIGILIMNSIIVYKLQKRNANEPRERSKSQRNVMLTVRNSLRSRPKIVNKLEKTQNMDSGPLVPPGSQSSPSENQLEPSGGEVENNQLISSRKDLDQAKSLQHTASLTPIELVKIQKAEKNRRTRTKATKLVVLVTTLGCVCWLPTHIINSWLYFDEASFPFTPEMVAAKLVSQALSFAASCVNPVVYGIMTGTFKATISNKLFRRAHKSNDRNSVANQRLNTMLSNVA